MSSLRMLCRRLGAPLARAPSAALSSVTLPANVLMKEGTAVFDPAPQPNIDPLEYLFPPLSVETSINIHKFLEPGKVLDVRAPLNPTVFGVAIRRDIVHEVVRYQRCLTRQPFKTKRSFEISGSTKKLYQQKGTGRAQAGNIRASHRKGGQKAHGPQLRSFAIGMNIKARAMGLMITLAAKHRENNLIVFDHFSADSHRTKDFMAVLRNHGLAEKKILIMDEDFPEDILKACRNVPTVSTLVQAKANVIDVIKREKLVISAPAFQHLQDRLVAQYNHTGKRRALLLGYDEMRNHRGYALLAASETNAQNGR